MALLYTVPMGQNISDLMFMTDTVYSVDVEKDYYFLSSQAEHQRLRHLERSDLKLQTCTKVRRIKLLSSNKLKINISFNIPMFVLLVMMNSISRCCGRSVSVPRLPMQLKP